MASSRRDDVQGLRAIAVFMVVAFHAGLPLRGGFVGVDVFFVISGYVITRLLARELDATGDLSLVTFYERRIRRLLPALTVLLVVVGALSLVLLGPVGPQQATASTGTAASLFGANLQLLRTPTGYFDLGADANALLHTWSLSLEEQFYLLFPATLLLASRAARKHVATLVALVCVASFAISWATTAGHGEAFAHHIGATPSRFAFFMPLTRAWEFGAGALVALAARWTQRIAGAAGELLALGGVALIATGGITITAATRFPGTAALLPVVGTALVIASGDGCRTLVSRALSLRPIVWVGDLSYSWYLWHWPAIVFVTASVPSARWAGAVVGLLALGPAWLSYRFVEQPLRANDGLRGIRSAGLLVTCMLAALAATFALRLGAQHEATGDHARLVADALRPHGDEQRGCTGGPAIDDPRCRWPVASSHGWILLVGDSNAGQLTEPLAAAANASGLDLAVSVRSACPFANVVADVERHDAASCTAFVERTLAAIEHAAPKPSLVVIASAASTYVDDATTVLHDSAGRGATAPADKAAQWERGVRATSERLARAGIAVLIIDPIPRLEATTLATCPYWAIVTDDRRCAPDAPRVEIEHQQQLARDAQHRAIAGIAGVATLDVTDELCSATTCSARERGDWTYRDAGHLSVAGALRLTRVFTTAIAAHASH